MCSSDLPLAYLRNLRRRIPAEAARGITAGAAGAASPRTEERQHRELRHGPGGPPARLVLNRNSTAGYAFTVRCVVAHVLVGALFVLGIPVNT